MCGSKGDNDVQQQGSGIIIHIHLRSYCAIMSSDTLTLTSRAFYERAKAKLAASIVLGAGALMLLGFCSEDAGLSSFNETMAEKTVRHIRILINNSNVVN